MTGGVSPEEPKIVIKSNTEDTGTTYIVGSGVLKINAGRSHPLTGRFGRIGVTVIEPLSSAVAEPPIGRQNEINDLLEFLAPR
jgi:hypothetical protein